LIYPAKDSFFEEISGRSVSDILLLFSGSVIVFLPLIFSGNWFDSHDGIRYLCLFEQFRDAFKEGIIYPRWLPDNYGGYGYPDFVFYQPAFFYFVLAVSFIVGDVLFSFCATLVLILFLGALGVYKLFCRLFNNFVALFGGLLFIITPYIFVNIYVRGDLAEFASMMLIPWNLYFLIRMRDSIDAGRSIVYDFIVSGILASLLVYTHPFTAMFFYPIFVLFSFLFSIDAGSKNAIRFSCLAVLLLLMGASLSAPYWFNAAMMKDYVNYKSALSGELQAHMHMLSPYQLFSRRWSFGGSVPGVSETEMSFQLGLPHFILACVGFLFSSHKRYKLVFILYIVLIISMLSPCAFLWRNIPLLRIVQFPWRLLSVIAMLQMICVGDCLMRISRFKTNTKIIVLAFISFIFLSSYWPMFFMKTSVAPVREVLRQHVEGRKMIMASYSSFNEFFPSYIPNPPNEARGTREMLQLPEGSGAKAVKLADSSPYRYLALISSPSAVEARVLQFYFPSFCVKVDHKDISDLIKNESDGTFSFPVPAGDEHLVEIFYAGTPFDFGALIILLAGTSVSLGIGLSFKKRKKV